MRPPQPHVAALFPLLEQNVQQWYTPGCGLNVDTDTLNGLPCKSEQYFHIIYSYLVDMCCIFSLKPELLITSTK